MTLDEARAAYRESGAELWPVWWDQALPQVRWALCDLKPSEWRFTSAYLRGLLDREPLKSSPYYVGARILLGTLAMELDILTGLVGDEPAETMRLYDHRGERELTDHVLNARAIERGGGTLRA